MNRLVWISVNLESTVLSGIILLELFDFAELIVTLSVCKVVFNSYVCSIRIGSTVTLKDI